MTRRLMEILCGASIRSFRLIEGGGLILYFGNRLGPQTEQEATRLWIESAWRLCSSHRIVAGSLDAPDSLLPRLNELKGRCVDIVRLDGCVGDIILGLESEWVIESFTRSTADEQWQLRLPNGFRLGLDAQLHLCESTEKPDEC